MDAKVKSGITLVRIKNLAAPSGCSPNQTEFLLVLSPQQDVPIARYVKDPITLVGGTRPNYTPTLVDGEPWYTFSYNFQWSPSDPMYLFVESAMTRFAKTS